MASSQMPLPEGRMSFLLRVESPSMPETESPNGKQTHTERTRHSWVRHGPGLVWHCTCDAECLEVGLLVVQLDYLVLPENVAVRTVSGLPDQGLDSDQLNRLPFILPQVVPTQSATLTPGE